MKGVDLVSPKTPVCCLSFTAGVAPTPLKSGLANHHASPAVTQTAATITVADRRLIGELPWEAPCPKAKARGFGGPL